VSKVGMPNVTERWPGGMLTNFPTIRKAVKKMTSIDKMMKDSSWDNLSKREKLQITRQRAKLDKILGSIVDLTRLPAALFIVDVMKEKIAVREAQRLGIPIFAMVDTNSEPQGIDFVIPANDDASESIKLIVGEMCDAIAEGLGERKAEREKDGAEKKEDKPKSKKASAKKEAVVEEEVEEVEEADSDEDVELDDIEDEEEAEDEE
jgi:small subunit ribosomal protein S2